MQTSVTTGGETVAITSEPAWVSRLIREAIAGEPPALGTPAVSVAVESDRRPLDITTGERLSRNTWRRGSDVVITNVLGMGFDALVRAKDDGAEFIYRWRPGAREHAASRVLRARFVLLFRAAIVQYPALWWAVVRGRAPLHASGIDLGATKALICGPGGVGKSTLFLREMQAGARATDDNMCVSDGQRIWGTVEPIRVIGGGGRRMPFGRSERAFPERAREIEPECVVVLRRAAAGEPMSARSVDATSATQAIVGGTYLAGELRRFWSFAAGLSLATGFGPPHPGIAPTVEQLTKRLPCVEVAISRDGIRPLADLLDETTQNPLREVGS